MVKVVNNIEEAKKLRKELEFEKVKKKLEENLKKSKEVEKEANEVVESILETINKVLEEDYLKVTISLTDESSEQIESCISIILKDLKDRGFTVESDYTFKTYYNTFEDFIFSELEGKGSSQKKAVLNLRISGWAD